MSRTALTAAPLLAGMLLLAACGAGSNDSSDAGSTSTDASAAAEGGGDKQAYLADSEAVCGTAKEQLDAIPAAMTAEDARGVFATGLSIVDSTTTRLEDLAKDSPDEEQVRTIFLEPLRGQADAIKEFLPTFEAALAKGPEAIAALEEPQLPEADVAAMQAYGFEKCTELAKQ